jgi:phage-related tail fiber protein
MANVSRLGNIFEDVAIKAPVRLATTASITLSGLQAIDSVTVAEGDRVLVKDQADKTQNGIWQASSGPWIRTVDAKGNTDLITGTLVFVVAGNKNAGLAWSQTCTDAPIAIGTSLIGWQLSQMSVSTGGALSFLWDFAGATADADPGTGALAFNNAAVASTTEVFADNSDFFLNDLTAVLADVAVSNSVIKARLRIAARGKPTSWVVFDVTGDATGSGYHKFTVAYVSSSSAAPFAAGDVVVASFDTVGAKGDTGASGPTGSDPTFLLQNFS